MWMDSSPPRPVSGWRRVRRGPPGAAPGGRLHRAPGWTARAVWSVRTSPYRRGSLGNRNPGVAAPRLAMAASLVLLVAGGLIGVQLDVSPVAPWRAPPRWCGRRPWPTRSIRRGAPPGGGSRGQDQHLVTWLTKRMGVGPRPAAGALGFGSWGGGCSRATMVPGRS